MRPSPPPQGFHQTEPPLAPCIGPVFSVPLHSLLFLSLLIPYSVWIHVFAFPAPVYISNSAPLQDPAQASSPLQEVFPLTAPHRPSQAEVENSSFAPNCQNSYESCMYMFSLFSGTYTPQGRDSSLYVHRPSLAVSRHSLILLNNTKFGQCLP